jgi:hypothetical protein
LAGKAAAGHKTGYTAVAAVRRRIAVAAPIGFAGVVAVHKAGEFAAGSTVLEVLDLHVAIVGVVTEDTETAPGDMEIGAAVLVVAVGVCYTPTVLEDTVKMYHKNWELLVVQMVTVAAHRNQDAEAWEEHAVVAAHRDLVPARRWADRRCS